MLRLLIVTIGDPFAEKPARAYMLRLLTGPTAAEETRSSDILSAVSSRVSSMTNSWPRDRSTGPGGGLSTGPGGGLSTGPEGGASTGPGGGMSTGPGGGISTGPGGGLSTGPGGGISTGPGGGLSTGPRGGLSTGPGGGLSTGPGGGLSTGPGPHYRSNIPPIHVFIPILRQRSYGWAADAQARRHGLDL